MRKLVFSTFLTCLFVFNAQAQDDETTSSDDYNKWQARVRVLAIAPAAYFYDDVNGVEVDMSSSFAPAIDITYFFSKYISAEMMITNSTHDVETQSGGDLGNISILAPTFSLQYHFHLNKFKPYIGVGINYNVFHGEDAGNLDAIEYKNDLGYLFQGGIDYSLSDKWFLNLDFKKVFLKTELTFDNDASTTNDLNVDPIMIGFGVGMKF